MKGGLIQREFFATESFGADEIKLKTFLLLKVDLEL